MRNSHPGTHRDPDIIIRGKYVRCWRDAALRLQRVSDWLALRRNNFGWRVCRFHPQTVLSLSLQPVSTARHITGRYRSVERGEGTCTTVVFTASEHWDFFQIWSEVKRARRGGVGERKECCLGEYLALKSIIYFFFLLNDEWLDIVITQRRKCC